MVCNAITNAKPDRFLILKYAWMRRRFVLLNLALWALGVTHIAALNLESRNLSLSRDQAHFGKKWQLSQSNSTSSNVALIERKTGNFNENIVEDGLRRLRGDFTPLENDGRKEGSHQAPSVSRIELVLGSQGVNRLNSSSVLILGANELSALIVTHLIRSGISSITIWDRKKELCDEMLKPVLLLNPDSKVRILRGDPVQELENSSYSTVIFANQPLREALEINEKFHGKTNFVYCTALGTYGLVMNDFGEHTVGVKSDDHTEERSFVLVQSGDRVCLEAYGMDKCNYRKNDHVHVFRTADPELSSADATEDGGLGKDTVETCKILNVERGDNVVRLWFASNSSLKAFNKGTVSVKKAEPSTTYNFSTFNRLLEHRLKSKKSLFNPGNSFLERFTRNRILRRILSRFRSEGRGIERLVIAPNCSNSLNAKSLTVLSSFVALDNLTRGDNRVLSPKGVEDLELDEEDVREVYRKPDEEVVSRFNVFKNLNIPPLTSLIGALAAQETIKGITNLFTPADLIIVDKSDIFTSFSKEGSLSLKEGRGVKDVKRKRDLDVGRNRVKLQGTDETDDALNEEETMAEEAEEEVKRAKKAIADVAKMRFVLVGCGALGCDYLMLLARMGVSDVLVFDNDVVDLSNLSRQVLFTLRDLGKPKAESALFNLSLLYDTKRYRAINRMFDYALFNQIKSLLFPAEMGLDSKDAPRGRVVGVSAVDNVEGRVTLDNFCVQTQIPLIESGIHGMKCSTSCTVPYFTESFSSSLAEDTTSNKYSCSAKGVPQSVDDCVFHALELFSWLFNEQHRVFNRFLDDPVGSVQKALNTGSDQFYNLLELVHQNLAIINELLSLEEAGGSESIGGVQKLYKVLEKWAATVYEKSVGFDSRGREQLINSLIKLKMSSVSPSEPPDEFDYDRFKLLVNQGFHMYHSNSSLDRGDLFKETDKFRNRLTGRFTKSLSNSHYKCALERPKEIKGVRLRPLVVEESSAACMDFLFWMTNMRAKRFKIPECPRNELAQRAKNIVPAVSTSVSIATALSLLELYKIPQFHDLVTEDLRLGDQIKTNIRNLARTRAGEYGFSGVKDELAISDRFLLRVSTDSGIKFYNEDKLVLQFRPFNYNLLCPDDHQGTFKGREHMPFISKLWNSYFNGSVLKYVSNGSNAPEVFKIEDKNSVLYGLTLSCWDFLHVYDCGRGQASTLSSSSKTKSALLGKLLSKAEMSRDAKRTIHLFELVDLVEFLFNVKVDALTFQDGYIMVNESNLDRLMFSLLRDKLGEGKGEVLLHLIARDKGSNKPIELPDIKYHYE